MNTSEGFGFGHAAGGCSRVGVKTKPTIKIVDAVPIPAPAVLPNEAPERREHLWEAIEALVESDKLFKTIRHPFGGKQKFYRTKLKPGVDPVSAVARLNAARVGAFPIYTLTAKGVVTEDFQH
jgi:hypothetical protein